MFGAVMRASCEGMRAGRGSAKAHVGRVLAIGAIAATLTACSSSSGNMFSFFAEPGKYAYYSCEQIAGQIKFWTQRQQELKSLMERAEQGTGGAAVSLIAYRSDYVTAGEELDVLRVTAHEKKCDQDAGWSSSTVIH